MIKFNQMPIYKQAVRIYLFSIIISFIFYLPFLNICILLFNPTKFGGGLFLSASANLDKVLSGAYLAYLFFLPLFVFYFIKNKKWLVWLIGAIIPLLIAIVGGGTKDIFWALVLSAIGWGLAQVILFIKKKIKK